MPLATPINKSISNHAKILLKEIKDVKTDRQKNRENRRQFTGQFDNVQSESGQFV